MRFKGPAVKDGTDRRGYKLHELRCAEPPVKPLIKPVIKFPAKPLIKPPAEPPQKVIP